MGKTGDQGMIRPLAEVFAGLSDPRDSRGQWHSLGTTLTLNLSSDGEWRERDTRHRGLAPGATLAAGAEAEAAQLSNAELWHDPPSVEADRRAGIGVVPE